MNTLTEIEAAIEKLPAAQVEKLYSWLDQRRLKTELPNLPADPDFLARAKAIWGENRSGTPLSELVSEARS